MNNPCIRCGNERVSSKTWKEYVAVYGRTSVVIHEEFVCTNRDCQKVVERQFSEQKAQRELVVARKEQEKQERIKAAIRQISL